MSKKILTNKEQIVEASDEMNIQSIVLAPESAKDKWAKIFQEFTTDGSHKWGLWDRPREFSCENFSVYNPQGWKWISDFVKNDKCLLLTDYDTLVEFESGHDLVRVIGETSIDEFYVTNDVTEYVICINHHDFVIAFGTAIPWLKTYS